MAVKLPERDLISEIYILLVNLMCPLVICVIKLIGFAVSLGDKYV